MRCCPFHKSCQVSSDLVSRATDLDNEVKVSLVLVRGSGRIRPDDVLAVDLCCDADVLADRETEYGVGGRQFKLVAGAVSYRFGCVLAYSAVLCDK